MTYDPRRHHRRSVRLPGYDYSRAGAYFLTICVQDREWLLGDVVNGEMRLSDAGRIVRNVWDELPTHYPHIDLDAFVIMPNHVHGVVLLFSELPDDNRHMPAQRWSIKTGVRVGAGLALPHETPSYNQRSTDDGVDTVTNNDAPAAMNGGAVGPMNGGAVGPICRGAASSAPTVGDVVRAFKSVSGISVNRLLGRVGQRVWQRNYYEHIIRNDDSLNRIRKYIADNPSRWEFDRDNPNATDVEFMGTIQ